MPDFHGRSDKETQSNFHQMTRLERYAAIGPVFSHSSTSILLNSMVVRLHHNSRISRFLLELSHICLFVLRLDLVRNYRITILFSSDAEVRPAMKDCSLSLPPLSTCKPYDNR